MKKKMVIIMTVCLTMTAVTGCGTDMDPNLDKNTQNQEATYSDNNDQQNNLTDSNETDDQNTGNTNNIIETLDEANIMGTVTDFTDIGCTVVEGANSEDEQKLGAAGAEFSGEDQIKVIYDVDVQIQLATAKAGAATASVEDSQKSELKKQSNVYLYGTYQENGSFLANKVIIYRTIR